MKAIEASAPGKVVLCGEYAVLAGGPAIAMAVDRRARVRITPTGEPFHRVLAPGRSREARFRARPAGALEWLDGGAEFSLLEHVWQAARPAFGSGVALVLDTRGFFDPAGRKLGLGSSAALAVALAAALGEPHTPADALYGKAAAAHRNFQGGKGSGIDVATAVHGGIVGYFAREPRVEPVGWPEGLALALLWSGRPADTALKLERLADAGGAGALTEAAALVYARWREGAACALDALGAWTRALLCFDEEHGLGIFAAGHRELHDEAAARGLVYKPCGAGGGDVGAVFARERDALRKLVEWAAERGFTALAARREPCGVTRTGALQ